MSTKDALDVLVKDAEGFDLVISDWDRPADGPNAGVSFLHALHGLPDTIRKPPLIFYHGEHRDSARKLRRVKALAAGAYGEAILPSELIALTMQSLAGYPSEDSAKKV